MNTTHLDTVIDTAESLLSPRAQYARLVLTGGQRWSGADLKGKARAFGGGYYRQRRKARAALHRAGGLIVASKAHGRLSTAVRVGCDDFGDAVYQTVEFGTVTARALR